MCVDFDVRGQQEMDFFTGEMLLWIMNLYFVQKQRFEVKHVLMMDLFLTNTQL